MWSFPELESPRELVPRFKEAPFMIISCSINDFNIVKV